MLTRRQRKQLNRSKGKSKAIRMARSARTKREKYYAKLLSQLAAWGISREQYEAHQHSVALKGKLQKELGANS